MSGMPPLPPPQGKRGTSQPSTIFAPFVQADYPHDTFKATPTQEMNVDPYPVGRGTRGNRGVINKVPDRGSYC